MNENFKARLNAAINAGLEEAELYALLRIMRESGANALTAEVVRSWGLGVEAYTALARILSQCAVELNPRCYIFSIKHTPERDKFVTFWGPNNAGYAYTLERAGIYTLSAVLEKPTYYDNAQSTLAAHAVLVEALSVVAPKEAFEVPGSHIVYNTPERLAMLRAARVNRNLGPIEDEEARAALQSGQR